MTACPTAQALMNHGIRFGVPDRVKGLEVDWTGASVGTDTGFAALSWFTVCLVEVEASDFLIISKFFWIAIMTCLRSRVFSFSIDSVD